MKSYVLICTVLWVQFSNIEGDSSTIIDVEAIVKKINDDPELTWKASTYGRIEMDMENFVNTRLGVALQGDIPLMEDPNILIERARDQSNVDGLGFPVNFTWADPKHSNCLSITHIRDQSNCGSCWAVASVNALQDRFCIQSKGKIKPELSYNFVTACSTANHGCYGGKLDEVNRFLVNTGTITGGDYNSDVGCQPYTVMPCGWPKQMQMPCAYDEALTPKCKSRKCNNDWYEHKEEPESRVFKGKSWKTIISNFTHTREDRIREDLLRNGPLMAGFWVPNDFPHYKKGVYVPGRAAYVTGAHAVRIVGYGIENELKYWHVANSWSPFWGDGGFFKILRGVNLLDIEFWSSSIMPELP